MSTSCFEGKLQSEGRSLVISAPAKINLFLKIVGRRSDGYHDIYSWFQAIDLCDQLEIERRPGGRIELVTDCADIPTDRENLVYQAARLIQQRLTPAEGVRVKLWKRIPVGAGLGGGSSDAAAFIKGANRLFDARMSSRQMAEMGLELGSDVPFFFSRGQAEVTGRGEQVKPIELPLDYQVVTVTPPFQIRAAEAYRKLKLDLTEPFANITFHNCRKATELFCIISRLANDLEHALVESYPILAKIRDRVTGSGASIVKLSGSGPTVFGLYEDRHINIKELVHCFEGEGWDVQVSRPVILPAQ